LPVRISYYDNIIVFSIVAIEYPEDKVVYFGYCESATGIGLMAGPIVGQVFYTQFGFEGCFYSTTVMLIGAGMLSHRYIKTNQTQQETVPKQRKSDEIMDIEDHSIHNAVTGDDISEWEFLIQSLRSPRVVMPIISCILGTIFLLFNEPIISDHLIEEGLS
jgi:hypothetical protein